MSILDVVPAVGKIIGTLPEVQGVLTNGGGYGVAQAFAADNRPTPIIIFGGRGTEMQWWQQQTQENGYVSQAWSLGPSIGSAAFWVGVQLAQGVPFPNEIEFPWLIINQDNLDEYVKATPLDGVAEEPWTNQMVTDQLASQYKG